MLKEMEQANQFRDDYNLCIVLNDNMYRAIRQHRITPEIRAIAQLLARKLKEVNANHSAIADRIKVLHERGNL